MSKSDMAKTSGKVESLEERWTGLYEKWAVNPADHRPLSKLTAEFVAEIVAEIADGLEKEAEEFAKRSFTRARRLEWWANELRERYGVRK